MKKVIRLIHEEVFMSDGQMYSYLQLFFNTEKIRLNLRLDSIVADINGALKVH